MATKITQMQDINENPIETKQIETVETGKKHTNIVDKQGFVYTVGQNPNGELGTGETKNKSTFTLIGDIEIVTKPKELQIPVNTTKEIEMELGYTFNLKKESAETGALKPTNTNKKEITLEDLNNPEEISSTKHYRLAGNKIGRVCVNVKSEEGYEKNLWIEVVDSENSQSSSKVVNGDKYTVALRADGSVWSFGTLNNNSIPTELETEEEIIDITSGKNHVLLLGKSGTVYSIGANAKGQLGTGNVTTYKEITKINLTGIEKVIAKENTSFAISKKGEIYAWGEGYTKTPTKKDITENVINVTKKYYLAEDGKVRKLADRQEITIF